MTEKEIRKSLSGYRGIQSIFEIELLRLLDEKDAQIAALVVPQAQPQEVWSYDISPPQGFIEYVRKNYSGDVHFHDPEWHALRLWNAAMKNAKPVQPKDFAAYMNAVLKSGSPTASKAAHTIMDWHQGLDVDAAPPAQPTAQATEPEYRGYAHLGTGNYLINHSASGEPAELIISIATEEQKAGRVIGDERDTTPGTVIQPYDMCVRIRFENAAGLAALEKQIRYVREVHFPDAPVAQASAEPDAERDGFEKWATNHGKLSLDPVGSGAVTRHGMFPATYWNDSTEIAWRAWANKPAIAAPAAPSVSADPLQELVDQAQALDMGYGPDTGRIYKARPRGIGSDWTPGCMVCGGETSLHTNCSFFVPSRETGEALVSLFKSGATLDYRPTEPNWIQVKVGVCATHKPSLEVLVASAVEAKGISIDAIDAAIAAARTEPK